MADHSRRGWAPAAGSPRVYALEVCLLSGPITEQFAKENPIVSRTIQMCGDQTLEQLHVAIFDAFDREDEHMYEFQVGGKGPMDPTARRYVLPGESDNPVGVGKAAGAVSRTKIEDLGLKEGQAFGYWFDFGDDWWHQINVVAIREGGGGGKCPKVTARVGASPPQYPGLDEDDDDDP